MRLEYPGRFLARIEDCGIYQSRSSKAVAVDFFFVTEAFCDGEERTEYAGYKTRGRFWVVGRSGDLLEDNVRSLADATGWDGDLQAILAKTWTQPESVQIVVEAEESDKGRTYHNAVRVLPADWKPSTPGNVGSEAGARIAATYTSALQSLVAKHRQKDGNPSGGRTAPNGRQKSPPQGEAKQAPPPAPEWNGETAWRKFHAKGAGMNEQEILEAWKASLATIGKPRREFTAEDWAAMAAGDPQIPF